MNQSLISHSRVVQNGQHQVLSLPQGSYATTLTTRPVEGCHLWVYQEKSIVLVREGREERKRIVAQGKSPSKAANVGTTSKDKEGGKVFAAITRGVPRANLPSKGTMKRKIFEMLVIHIKDRSVLMKARDRSMLVFHDSEKVGGTKLNLPLGDYSYNWEVRGLPNYNYN